jgi:NADH:ubiquinone oxidoreductase subunit C
MKKHKVLTLAKKIGKPYKQDKWSVWVEVKPADLRKALEAVREVDERISDLSIYDTGSGKLEATYRFFINGIVLNLKTSMPEDKPRLPTCTGLFPGALLIEREQHEMFGIVFQGHPSLDRIMFTDSTPETPLRRKSAPLPAKPAIPQASEPKPAQTKKPRRLSKHAYKVVPAGKVKAEKPSKPKKIKTARETVGKKVSKKKDDNDKEDDKKQKIVVSHDRRSQTSNN